jgi:hypothetical protein
MEPEMLKEIPYAVVLCVALGCASGSEGRSNWTDEDGDEPETAGDDADTALDESSEAEAVWWRLSADLDIAAGEIIAERSSISAEILDEERFVICSVSASVASGARESELPHETIFEWWTVSVEDWGDGCSGTLDLSSLPVEFQLGLGEMHPEILAVLDNLVQAEDGSEQVLHGAFASFDFSESLLVFGAGGTTADFAGESSDEDESGLSGTYFIHPLYPFVYPLD